MCRSYVKRRFESVGTSCGLLALTRFGSTSDILVIVNASFALP